jgi:uncharacterized protein
MRVAMTGSSGLIGTAVRGSLRADGHEVVRLVRRAPHGADEIRWNPEAVDAGLDTAALEGVDAFVHLAGAGVADHRWTPRHKAEIRASRVLATRALVGALGRMSQPPAVLAAASAIGWYGNTGGREVDESAPSGDGFLPHVVRDWEAAADAARDHGIRVVHLRSGIVLSRSGGMLAKLLPAARLGVLPRFGSGEQVMSWISITDEVHAIRFILNGSLDGPVNLTSPRPVTNAEFTTALLGASRRRDVTWLRVPEAALRLGLGEMSSELLNNAWVVPQRLADAGFPYTYPGISAALEAELRAR